MSGGNTVRLYEQPVYKLHEMLTKKEITAKDITESFVRRITETENNIDSFVTLCFESATEKAEQIDKQIAKGDKISPLAGIPMGIKDNICTKNIKTTCASKMLENFIPTYDATAYENLDNKGAILLGKLNMDEFAMGGSTENSYFKKTKNPWDLSRVPGGSSGGSAAAVSSKQVAFSLGSDTGGSVRQPASFCGVVGLKPTYGSISRFGLVAFASSLDQIGPITSNVTDSALVLNAIAGYDKKDSTSANFEHPDYTKFLNEDIRGKKIGIPKEFLSEGLNIDVKTSILKSIDVFKSLGALVEEFSLPINDFAIPAYYLISSAEASSNLARFDGVKYGFRAEKFDSLIDLYKQSRSEGFGSEVKRRIMLGTYALSAGYYDAYYKKAQQARTLILKSYHEAFEKYDLILGPTAPTTAFKIGEKSDNPLEMYLMDIYTVSINIAGLPAISIPCGFDSNNLPVGMQLIAKPFGEPTLLQSAYAFEQSTEYHLANAKI